MIKHPNVFIKAQLSSVVSTLTDFAVTFLFTYVLGFWYVFSSFSGTVAGGITNFSLNRNWVFKTKDHNRKIQALKFIVIWGIGMVLNTSGVFLLTDIFKLYYLFSKALVASVIGVFFNYYFQHTFVFAKNNGHI